MPNKTKDVKPQVIDDENPATNKIIVKPLPRINITYILFTLLIIASFLIGVLVTQVRYLEKGITLSTTNTDSELATEETFEPQAPTGPVDVDEGNLPILGNKDAKVTVVEFSDFECPFCQSFFQESLSQIKKDYIDTGKIKFAYRHYPLTEIHPNAQKSAEASECANAQGNFWDFHDLLFEKQEEWSQLDSAEVIQKFVEYANNIGLNGETLKECVTSGQMTERVNEDAREGSKAGVDGTPATFINGILISGAVPYEEIKAEIDKALGEN